MNKKLLSVVLSATCVLALAACGNANDTKVLEDTEHAAYVVAGPGENTVDGQAIAWEYTAGAVMKAASKADVKAVSADLYKAIKSTNLTALYMIDKLELGAKASGWTSCGYKDGKGVIGDGSLTVKAICVDYQQEDDNYVPANWYPSPEMYGETLTPSTLWMPGHSDVADELGLDHNANPLCVSGAGTYTLVLAKYAKANAAGSLFGMGLVQNTANENGQQVKEIVDVEVESLEIIGSFNNWSDQGTVELVKGEDGYVGSVKVDAGAEFKVRANKAWTFSWGFDAIDEEYQGLVAENGGNIVATKGGTYTLTIEIPSVISVKDSSLNSFKVEYVADIQTVYEYVEDFEFTSEVKETAEMTYQGVVVATSGNSFYLQDGDYGMLVYKKAIEGNSVGKVVRVTSTLQLFSGLIETKTISAAEIVGEVETLPAHKTVTSLAELAAVKQNINVDMTVTLPETAIVWSGEKSPLVTVKLGEDNLTIKFDKSAFDQAKLDVLVANAGKQVVITGAVSAAYSKAGETTVNQVMFVTTSLVAAVA